MVLAAGVATVIMLLIFRWLLSWMKLNRRSKKKETIREGMLVECELSDLSDNEVDDIDKIP